MSLKLIPVEPCRGPSAKQRGGFNPGAAIKKRPAEKNKSLRGICLRLVHYINKGEKYTLEQIDELIINMQRSILNLQKKKQEVIRRRTKKR